MLDLAVDSDAAWATADVRSPRNSRVEIIALDVYQRAEDAGPRITLPICEQRLAELRVHRPTCRSGPSGTIATAKARNVFAVAERSQRWACARDRAIVIESTRKFHRPAVVTKVVEYVTPNGRHSERNEIGAGVDIKAIHRVDQSHASDLHEILERFATAGLSAGPV